MDVRMNVFSYVDFIDLLFLVNVSEHKLKIKWTGTYLLLLIVDTSQ